MTAEHAREQLVYSQGHCHGLPSLDDNIRGLSAIVVGASGMSGQSMVDILVQTPTRWNKIFALCRRPPKATAESVKHVPMDLLKTPEDNAATLSEHSVRADVVFFFGYVQLSAEERKYSGASEDSAQKLADVNESCSGKIFKSFLTALDLASIRPKRILLQTGLKNYQGHQGPAKVPFDEADPRINLGPLFYFDQEDILFEHCRTHHSTSYNVTMPSWIIGAVEASDMTTIYPLAVYASVQRQLGQLLAFPGDTAAWEKIMPMSSAVLNSLFHEWVVLTDNTANQRFNIVDGSEFTWMAAWPRIAEWFGIEWSPPQEDESLYRTVEMPVRPRGYGPKGRCRSSFDLIEWSQRPHTRAAWKTIKEEHELKSEPLAGPGGMFAALQFSLTTSWSWATKMDKARKYGWHGFVDSAESLHGVMVELAKQRMLPPI
ncbi:hypothetical protein LTR78_006430 [Recurvomyces mirabilis]|uniref:PRISE-like Rossmann-fold domain-containing protein n=1 Tax=Recurvomyces mirabilis TaxID=574656 RepID=A0AAE0WKR7_9PEZI|nr:hypothetical protein LTR78_006430 [Recurvomyces mirabilis]KAK5151153.1 hypothetical protein LTS14_009649 [Recurvomyces mirabilis]